MDWEISQKLFNETVPVYEYTPEHLTIFQRQSETCFEKAWALGFGGWGVDSHATIVLFSDAGKVT